MHNHHKHYRSIIRLLFETHGLFCNISVLLDFIHTALFETLF